MGKVKMQTALTVDFISQALASKVGSSQASGAEIWAESYLTALITSLDPVTTVADGTIAEDCGGDVVIFRKLDSSGVLNQEGRGISRRRILGPAECSYAGPTEVLHRVDPRTSTLRGGPQHEIVLPKYKTPRVSRRAR